MITELLTPRQTAEFLKVSVHSLAKWRQLKTGPAYTRTGNRIKYSRKALETYLKQNAVSN